MNVEIEEIGPCKKLIKVEVPKETIEDEWQKQLNKLCQMANLPGFRKGKAPKSFVEKKYSDRLMEEVRQTVVTDSYQSAIENNNLSPVGEPEISDINLELGKPLNFEVKMEVLPTFEIGEYKGMQLKRGPVTVTKEDVENALKSIRMQRSQLVEVKDGKVEEDDLIVCDCELEVDGVIVREKNEMNVMVSGSRIADINVPDLKEKLVGTEAGKECSIKVELGGDFAVEEHRNKPAELKLFIKKIKRPDGPEINDELAKKVGSDSLEELREFLSKQIEVEKKKLIENDMREHIYKNLLKMADFDLPRDMVESQASKKLENYRMELLNKGTPMEEIESNLENLKNTSEEAAIKDFKLSLVLKRIAEKEKIFVTEAEVDHKIKSLASMYGVEPSKMRSQLEKLGSLSNLRHQMKESKTVDLIMKEAVTEEINEKENK